MDLVRWPTREVDMSPREVRLFHPLPGDEGSGAAGEEGAGLDVEMSPSEVRLFAMFTAAENSPSPYPSDGAWRWLRLRVGEDEVLPK